MTESPIKITLLGTRGSVPVAGNDFVKYKGATSCVRILAGNQEIYIDAGSGIVNVIPEKTTDLSILLTHAHLDHLLGLPFFNGLIEKERNINIYYKERNGLHITEILKKLFNPPLWPLGVYDYPADVSSHDMPDSFDLGDVHIDTMEGNHPGGVTIFRISYQDKSFVYATDYEHRDDYNSRLIEFSKDCNILFYDGQYKDEDYESHRGYGHSTASNGIAIAKAANVGQLFIIHHDPKHTDSQLDELEQKAKKQYKNISYAKCDQEIFL